MTEITHILSLIRRKFERDLETNSAAAVEDVTRSLRKLGIGEDTIDDIVQLARSAEGIVLRDRILSVLDRIEIGMLIEARTAPTRTKDNLDTTEAAIWGRLFHRYWTSPFVLGLLALTILIFGGSIVMFGTSVSLKDSLTAEAQRVSEEIKLIEARASKALDVFESQLATLQEGARQQVEAANADLEELNTEIESVKARVADMLTELSTVVLRELQLEHEAEIQSILDGLREKGQEAIDKLEKLAQSGQTFWDETKNDIADSVSSAQESRQSAEESLEAIRELQTEAGKLLEQIAEVERSAAGAHQEIADAKAAFGVAREMTEKARTQALVHLADLLVFSARAQEAAASAMAARADARAELAVIEDKRVAASTALERINLFHADASSIRARSRDLEAVLEPTKGEVQR